MNYRFLRYRSFCAILTAVCLGAVSSFADLSDTENEVLMTALSAEPNEADEGCAYTQTSQRPIDDEGEIYVTIVSRYDPGSNPESSWELLSVDGEPPSEVQIANFEPRSSRHPVSMIRMLQFPEIDQMELTSKEDDIWTFEGPARGLDMNMEGPFKGMQKKLRLAVEVHAPTSTLKSAKMYLKKPHRIFLIGKISEMENEIAFEIDPAVGALVATNMTMEMKASGLGRRVSVSEWATFTDFDCTSQSLAKQSD